MCFSFSVYFRGHVSSIYRLCLPRRPFEKVSPAGTVLPTTDTCGRAPHRWYHSDQTFPRCGAIMPPFLTWCHPNMYRRKQQMRGFTKRTLVWKDNQCASWFPFQFQAFPFKISRRLNTFTLPPPLLFSLFNVDQKSKQIYKSSNIFHFFFVFVGQ